MKMILKRAINSLLLLVLCFGALSGYAQEMLVDLNSNQRLGNWEQVKRDYFNSSRAVDDTLSLPFFDDFSEPFSRLNRPSDLFPSLDLWIGKTVYVNNHMAINPISQGVATFDGLDENGQAYGFGFSLPTLSDSLTSKPIDLSSAADVFLSFYYQAQGMGNAPEAADLLVLEFKDTAGLWQRVWEAEGYILTEYDFKRAMLPVLGDEYLYKGFQFRFLNYASRAGSVDHWHVDYVDLDENRTVNDTLINDLAFLGQTSFDNDTIGFQNATASILEEYHSMPWTHYKEDAASYMGAFNFFMARNNFDTIVSPNYKFNIFNSDGMMVFDDTLSSPQVYPLTVSGNQSNTGNFNSFSNFTFWTDGFVFPTNVELSEDSAYFVIKHLLLLGTEDENHTNDTSAFVQEFYNYYAYDDGTAELAYGLGNLENDGMVAVKFDIKKADSLQSIQIYLNPLKDDLSQEPVKLMVWSGPSEPEDVIYESPEFITLSYSEGMNYFYNYKLENAKWLEAGTIWVGWKQQAATGIKFSVGLDRRSDVSSKLFYNLGATWNQSSIPGAVMIRPVFGEPFDWVSGVEENRVEQIAVYPNPTTGTLYLKESFLGELRNANLTVHDLTGRVVLTQAGYGNQIELGHLIAGTYILRVRTESDRTLTQRIVLQP